MGSYDDFKQLKNLQRMPGISFVKPTDAATSSTTTTCKNNMKRKIVGDRPSKGTTQKSSECVVEKINSSSSSFEKSKSSETSTSEKKSSCLNSGSTAACKVDLRDKINKKRCAGSGTSSAKMATHKALKERMRSNSGNLLEFTKLPDRTAKGAEEESKHRKQVKYRVGTSLNSIEIFATVP